MVVLQSLDGPPVVCEFLEYRLHFAPQPSVPERFIDLPGLPQPVKQNGQFAGDGDDRSLLGRLATTLGQLETPASKIAIRPMRPQDVLGRAYK